MDQPGVHSHSDPYLRVDPRRRCPETLSTAFQVALGTGNDPVSLGRQPSCDTCRITQDGGKGWNGTSILSPSRLSYTY